MRKTALENKGFLENLPLLYRAGGGRAGGAFAIVTAYYAERAVVLAMVSE